MPREASVHPFAGGARAALGVLPRCASPIASPDAPPGRRPARAARRGPQTRTAGHSARRRPGGHQRDRAESARSAAANGPDGVLLRHRPEPGPAPVEPAGAGPAPSHEAIEASRKTQARSGFETAPALPEQAPPSPGRRQRKPPTEPPFRACSGSGSGQLRGENPISKSSYSAPAR